MSDVLEKATRALRDDGVLDARRKLALRQRVTSSKKRSNAIRWVLPFAAVFVAGAAWAGWRGHHVAVAPPFSPPAQSATPIEVHPPAQLAVARVTTPVEIARPPLPVATSARAVSPPREDAERVALRAYREAERLQFTEKDCARALDAWDRYLARSPTGPLVVDARYDRAVCLAELGRRDEARDALAPFAASDAGTYRQAEAKTLLESLR